VKCRLASLGSKDPVHIGLEIARPKYWSPIGAFLLGILPTSSRRRWERMVSSFAKASEGGLAAGIRGRDGPFICKLRSQGTCHKDLGRLRNTAWPLSCASRKRAVGQGSRKSKLPNCFRSPNQLTRNMKAPTVSTGECVRTIWSRLSVGHAVVQSRGLFRALPTRL
jgi:hypothetical protein